MQSRFGRVFSESMNANRQNRPRVTQEDAAELILQYTREVSDAKMVRQPVVSVLILTYNHVSFIAQAMDGALMQKAGFHYEIIAGDDHSTDGTTEILLDYQKRHPDKIRVLLATTNLGQFTGNGRLNFIRLLNACRGQYIALLDGDDYWTDSAKLQRQADLMVSQPDVTLCGHHAMVLPQDGDVEPYVLPGKGRPSTFTLADVVKWNWMPTCTLMIRREIAGSLPEWFLRPALADWPLQVYAATRGKVAFLDLVMGCYRLHPGGYWSNVQKVREMDHFLEFYKIIRPHIPTKCWKAVGKRRVTECHMIRAVARETAGEQIAARREAWAAISSDPGIILARPFWTIGSLFKIHHMTTALRFARFIRRIAQQFRQI